MGELPVNGALRGRAHHGLHLGEHLGQQVGIVRQSGGFGQFGGVNVTQALAAHQVLQHLRQRILGIFVAVGRIEWIGGHDPADRRCDY